MRELNWRGCYDKNLKGIICNGAFSHPAKFAYGLICKIYAHLLERGWLQEGDLIADPFAGCGIGGIVAAANGLRWIGVELEQKFIDLTVGFDCDGIVERHQEEAWIEPRPSGWFVRLRIKAQYWDAAGESGFGGPKGDGWATEKEAQVFADSIADSEELQGYPLNTLYWEPIEGHYTTKWVCDKPAKCGSCEPHDPHHVTGSFELHREQWEKMGKPYPIILQGDSRQFSSIIREAVDSIVTSPPFQQSLATRSDESTPAARGIKANGTRRAGSCTTGDYGISEGQIGTMKEGNIDQVVDSIVTSPPYSESIQGGGDRIDWSNVGGRTIGRGAIGDGYGAAEGQIGAMKEGKLDEVVAVITSPPFLGAHHGCATDVETRERIMAGKLPSLGHLKEVDYGQSEGQLGGMPEGDHTEVVDSIITSPPFLEQQPLGNPAESYKGFEHIGSVKLAQDGYGQAEGQLGKMKEGDHGAVINGIVTSPPYADSMTRGGHLVWQEQGKVGAHKDSKGKSEIYSADPSNMGNLPEGDHGAVISGIVTSPPYAGSSPEASSSGIDIEKQWQTYRSQGGGMSLEKFREQQARHSKGYSANPANMGNLPEGNHTEVIDGIVTSPPYAQVMQRNKPEHPNIQEADGDMQKLRMGHTAYGESADQLGNLPEGSHEAVVDAVVTSPPYEALGAKIKGHGIQGAGVTGDKHYGQAEYGESEGQIGQERGHTYWEAVSQVYQESYKVLRGGGVMAVVVKAFVRNKQIVDLPAQTLELLEAIGFEPLERIRAWMTSPATQKSLMPDMVEDYTKAKKSFFRRLAERKGSPKIDFEEVLVVCKPVSDCH